MKTENHKSKEKEIEKEEGIRKRRREKKRGGERRKRRRYKAG
jgi:hypothetical protein